MMRLLMVILVCLAGCFATYDAEVEVEALAPMPFDEVGRGHQALADSVHRAVRTAMDWAALQDSLSPLRPFAEIDFDLEMVVVAAMPVPGGGYDLRFEEFEDTGDSVVGRYRLYSPGDDCRLSMGPSSVFQVVRMAQTDKAMTFERITEAVDCTEP